MLIFRLDYHCCASPHPHESGPVLAIQELSGRKATALLSASSWNVPQVAPGPVAIVNLLLPLCSHREVSWLRHLKPFSISSSEPVLGGHAVPLKRKSQWGPCSSLRQGVMRDRCVLHFILVWFSLPLRASAYPCVLFVSYARPIDGL